MDAAIEAHGGYEALRAASTWVAEVRRFQRGDSYVVTSYYRPGMVRMEQDLGDGERSADVIGDPHCWGMSGPASIPCSPETRENDRPRVVMEMAAQLWLLKGDDWLLLGAEVSDLDGESVDLVTARYLPRDSEARFVLDGETHLLRSISVDGLKEGVLGTHLHTYSEYEEQCGVMMASHNEKSFEGATWVAEDVLQLTCQPVDEELFVRPPQVAEGTIVASAELLSLYSLEPYDESSSALAERLRAEAATRNLTPTGPIRVERYNNDGMGPTGELVVELQLPVAESGDRD